MKNKKVFIAGGFGMVGRSIVSNLKKNNYKNILIKSRKDLDLCNYEDVKNFFSIEKPNIVINAAAKVGGILANSQYPYEFLIQNLQIQNNLIASAFDNNVDKFIFLGSSCIYPKLANQPIQENELLSGYLEKTNESYAIAKIAGIKLCEALRKQYGRNFISIMPCNLYGPYDNFDLTTSHVLPAIIRKFHEAKEKKSEVLLWGSGKPLREFLFVDDLADAIIFTIENNLDDSIYNVGSSSEISIRDLAITIKNIIKFDGEIKWDSSKPDGTPRKIMDSSKFYKYGWKPSTSLSDGIKQTYEWYKNNNIIKG